MKKIIAEITILVLLLAGFVIINLVMMNNKACSFRVGNDGNGCAYQIEDLQITDKEVIIKGWFFETKKVRNKEVFNNEGKELGILLAQCEKESSDKSKDAKGIILEIEYQKRYDVNKYFKCEYDYSNSGFIARIEKSKLDLDNNSYCIVFKPDKYGETGIVSSEYIIHKQLYHTSDLDMFTLDTAGTDLEKIVKNGICLTSYDEGKICVYQYDEKLYWIMDGNYADKNDSQLKLQCIVETTQFDKLPEERQKEGLYWDDKGFNFEAKEITSDYNFGKYRVAVTDIPKEYSITVFVVGVSRNNWVWQRKFRPVYQFE